MRGPCDLLFTGRLTAQNGNPGSTSVMNSGNCKLLFILLLFAALTSLFCFAESEQQDGEQQDNGKGFWDDYKVIVERNIFSRNRGRPPRRRDNTGEPKEVIAPNPESYFVLKGIVQQDKEYIAFLEETQSGKMIRAKIGDKIARGTLKGLTLDYIEFELNSNTMRIQIGNNLEGRASSVAFTYDNLADWAEASSQAPDKAAAGDGTTQQDEDSDVLRRLMQRREEQVGE